MFTNDFIKSKIEEAGNKIFGITFIKQNGEIRQMTARRNVFNPKHSPTPMGKVDRSAEDDRTGCLTVYDMNKRTPFGQGAYRRFKFDDVLSLKVNGKTFKRYSE